MTLRWHTSWVDRCFQEHHHLLRPIYLSIRPCLGHHLCRTTFPLVAIACSNQSSAVEVLTKLGGRVVRLESIKITTLISDLHKRSVRISFTIRMSLMMQGSIKDLLRRQITLPEIFCKSSRGNSLEICGQRVVNYQEKVLMQQTGCPKRINLNSIYQGMMT